MMQCLFPVTLLKLVGFLLLMMLMPSSTMSFSFLQVIAPWRRRRAANTNNNNAAVNKVNGNNKGSEANNNDMASVLRDQVLQAPSLLDQLVPYTNMPLEHSITLPPQAYTSQALFEVEKQRVLQPSWICVAHVSQIGSNPGDYITLDLLDERLLIVNAGDNDDDDESSSSSVSSKKKKTKNIQVLSRVCSHRWALVCEETTGKGSCGHAINKFTCPMHRWSFDLEGNLIGTPYMDDVRDFDKSTYHGLKKYKSETIGGFVYVNIDGTAEPLAPQIAELTAWMENWETEDAQLFNFDYELNYDCDFNWVRTSTLFVCTLHHNMSDLTTHNFRRTSSHNLSVVRAQNNTENND